MEGLTFFWFVTLSPTIFRTKDLATDVLRFFTRPLGASFRMTKGML